jgi:hypothetical protein
LKGESSSRRWDCKARRCPVMTFSVLKSRADLPKIKHFQEWLFAELAVPSKWRGKRLE